MLTVPLLKLTSGHLSARYSLGLDRTTATSYLRVGSPYIPDFLRPLRDTRLRYFEKIFGESYLEIGPIPAGTPVNLLANLDLIGNSTDPAEQAKHRAKVLQVLRRGLSANASRNDARNVWASLADPLLALSKCPDLVVNRGHYFGTSFFGEETGLSDEDKRALIEFLKTF